MKQSKTYIVILILLIVLIIPSVVLAYWWNPFSWSIWGSGWGSVVHKKAPIECVTTKNCQDIHKNCYYSCSANKCGQINTLVASKPYPDCSTVVSCTPKWKCGWGPCKNGYKSMVVSDSNNCGLSSSTAEIACPSLVEVCTVATGTSSCQSDSDCREMPCPTLGVVHEKCIEGKCAFSDEVVNKCSSAIESIVK